MIKVEDVKPKGLVDDVKPKLSLVEITKPKMADVHTETQIYFEGGRGIPMGLLLCLTYSHRI